MATSDGSARDELLIMALASGATSAVAAAACGCSERTVTRKLADASFRARVGAARLGVRQEIYADATSQMARLLKKALTQLEGLVSTRNLNVRLGAVRLCVDAGLLKGRALDDFEARLQALEARAQAAIPPTESSTP